MTEDSNIKLIQKRACKVHEGEWLPNLGVVRKIMINGEKIRFYFDRSASREFEIGDIVYCDERNKVGSSRAGIPRRPRPLARKGVAIE